MKKILLAPILMMLFCGIALAGMTANSVVPSDFSEDQHLLKSVPAAHSPAAQQKSTRIGQLPTDDMIDLGDLMPEFAVDNPSYHTPPLTLVDITEVEPNDSRATANPMACSDRVYCGHLDATADPSDYFTFTLDGSNPSWRVIVETTPTDPLECTPSISGTVVYLYNSLTVDNRTLIGYDTYSGYNGTHGLLMVEQLPPGQYWIRVLRDAGATGYYHAYLSCEPDTCSITCPPGSLAEGEVMPDTNYVDSYNIGCGATVPPYVFTPYTVGQTMCGTAGTWLKGTSVFRDIDYYSFTVAEAGDVQITATAEFFGMIFVRRGYSCPDTYITGYYVLPCEETSFTVPLEPGGYHIQFLPANFRFGPELPTVLNYYFKVENVVAGENCAAPISIPGLPYTDVRSSCGFANDYDLLGGWLDGPDVVYEMTLSSETTMDISLCTSQPDTFDTYLAVWAETDCGSLTPLAYDDDGCPGSTYGTSEITAITLAAGTYYILFDQYTYESACGPYTLEIIPAQPCIVECPVGATPEGEVACYDGYYDNYNAGCNNPGNHFTPIAVGQTICGNTGYYTVPPDSARRDTDWYLLNLAERGLFTYKGCGQVPMNFYIIKPGPVGFECDSLVIAYSTSGAPCDTAMIQTPLLAGTYWIWASVQTGLYAAPCSSTYWISVDWESMPDFPLVGLAQTGNVPNVGVSNIGALGESGLQGNTFNWASHGAKDFAGSFVFGNSPSYLFWKYGDNTYVNPPRGVGDLNLTDPFHPLTGYDDGGINGLEVEYCGQGYTAPPEAGDLFLHTFKLVNNGTTSITDLYGAVFMDWDIIGPDAGGDSVYFDRTNRLVYQKGVGVNEYYAWALVNNAPLRNLTGISQEIYSYNTPGGGGWLPESLWVRITSAVDGNPLDSLDMSSLISTGPYTLAPGGSATIVLAQIGAANVNDVLARAALAGTLDNPCISTGPDLCDYRPGDINGNNVTNGIDVGYGVNYFKGGPVPPIRCDMCPQPAPFFAGGDVNGNCIFNGIDITFFVNYLKGIVPTLLSCPSCPPAP